jgi:hypothetical protein
MPRQEFTKIDREAGEINHRWPQESFHSITS